MITYQKFNKQRMIRRASQLFTPPISKFSSLVLPKLSSIHFPQFQEPEWQIEQDHFLLASIKKNMYGFCQEYYSNDEDALGSPIHTGGSKIQEINYWYTNNPRIKRPNSANHGDDLTMGVYCYGLMNKRYRYVGSRRDLPLCEYRNYFQTVFSVLSREAKDGRHHFVILEAPKFIPSVKKLQDFRKLPLTKDTLPRAPTQDYWFCIELWNWIYGNLENCPIFSKLDPTSLKNINVILKYNDICTIFNLQHLMNFNKDFAVETIDDGEGMVHGIINGDKGANKLGRYDSLQFGKRVLSMLVYLREQGSYIQVVDDEDIDTTHDMEDLEDDIDSSNTMDVDESLGDLFFDKPKNNWRLREQSLAALDEEIENDDGDVSEEEVDARLSALNDIEEYVHEETLQSPNGYVTSEPKNVVLDEKPREEKPIEDEDDEVQIDTENLAYKPYKQEFISDNPEVRYGGILQKHTNHLTANGRLTAGELRHTYKLISKYHEIKDPRGKTPRLVDYLEVTPQNEELSYDDEITNERVEKALTDKSMTKSSLKQFDAKYVRDLMPKHTTQVVMELAKIGIAIQDYDIERVTSINDDFEIHSIKVSTLQGKTSTVRFRMPVVSEDGTFVINGVKQRMRKQWSDLPIRKIAPDEVALTSYYSKLFICRTTRTSFNSEQYIIGKVIEKGFDKDDSSITELRLNNVFDNYVKLPRNYTMFAKKISSFECRGYHFNFDNSPETMTKLFGEKREKGKLPVAYNLKHPEDVIYMGYDGLITVDGNKSSITEFIGLEMDKIPTDYAEVTLFKKKIPIVFMLGYWVGLGNLFQTLEARPTRYKRVPKDVTHKDLVIKFRDEVLVFTNISDKNRLILAGLNRYKNDLKRLSVYDFDDKEAYSNVFENNNIELRYIKEFQTMFPMWVDPITEAVLIQMKEPTDFVLLLIRACELLLTDFHPDSIDTSYMRIRGYERFAGMVYSELVKEARNYNYRPNRKDKQFSINPDAVWYSILKDQSIIITEECNPVHNLKEQEIVVFSGAGGRSGDSMTGSSRKFHKNAKGVVSEATVDNKDTGAIVYLTSNPNLSNMYGMIVPDESRRGYPPSQLVSTSMLLAPGLDLDDPKRANFTSVQNSQTMSAKGYKPLPIRTGYERVISGRVGDKFCKVAEDSGIVSDISNGVMTVEYANGQVGKYEVGTSYIPWSGKTVEQTTITDFKRGDKFLKGEVLLYNPAFFKKDKLIPNQVSMSMQTLARVALIEGGDVYEDSCAISSEFSKELSSQIVHIRNITLDNTQDIKDLIKVGDTVYPDSILCTIVNTQTDSSFYDDETLELLKRIASTNPKAKYKGTVSRIEVIYTGEVEDMPDNVKEVAIACDKEIYRKSRKLGTNITGGRVDIGFRIDGKALGKDTTVIKVYIVSDLDMITGDKLVVGNQLKGTIARVWTDRNTDEDDIPIDAYFSGMSIDNRIVDSPYILGTTSTLMLEVTKRVVDDYFN